ncbi:hypothetical protein I350_03976 [Cryptococcus amylolentus CBS 6273]|uniref:Protein EFR3 n=1 Tax=Cryptococcus amylolentus CBS 6273 TaxID=1296118 RepID=A0A1E3K0N1_9TREE|nr:hypothetical protein I350_03976 [Cryptococcus amylolentus CBS 6273]
MGCLPCTNLQPEVQHLNACYPPSKALLTAGPEFRPLAQDLSKLTYFATNKPSKLAKIGEELEKRVIKESQRSSQGYPKYRASLLISLAILRALLTECKRDIALFARPALRIIDTCLGVKGYQQGSLDLEVVGRATASFIAFTTYTDGSQIGADDALTKTYLTILRKYASMATTSSTTNSEKPDLEQQNRTRLIALAALNGATTSDAIFSSSRDFSLQSAILIPPLLQNAFEEPIHQLKQETAKIEMDASPSPFFNEFAATKGPIAHRRAPSLHAHIPGEKGPSGADVLSAALRSFHALVRQCNVAQASLVIDRAGEYLDKTNGWQDSERCCWLSERLTAWITLQYRFVVPTRLVESLVDLQDTAPSPKHISSLAMISTILTSTTSLIGLGVSDLLQNFISLIIRRIHLSPLDALLPPLVQCVGSLGTHIYYADQINDIVEELAARISELPLHDKARGEVIRVLVACITGVILVADAADDQAEEKVNGQSNGDVVQPGSPSKGKSPAPPVETPLPTPLFERPRPVYHPSRRNPISPEVWQETLPLLCEADYGVRAAYARALILFIETELPRGRIPGKAGEPGTAIKRPQSDAATVRFCNALNAAVYTLVISSCLGPEGDGENTIGGGTMPVTALGSPEVGTSGLASTELQAHEKESSGSSASGRATPKGERGVSFKFQPSEDNSANTGTSTPPKKALKPRRVSLPMTRLQSSNNLSIFSQVATPLDFAAALRILDAIHVACPVQALISGVPMLLALDEDAGRELVRRSGDGRAGAWVLERKRAVREMVGLVWRRIGERWGMGSVEQLANEALSLLPEPFLIPAYPAPPNPLTLLTTPDEPTAFIPHAREGESSATAKPLLNPTVLLGALSRAEVVQGATGWTGGQTERVLGTRWNVEKAIRESVERFSSANVRPDDDSHYAAAASLLMNMNNASYQSVNDRRVSRAIDVTDLRDALGGRADIITSSNAPSINSYDGSYQSHSQQTTSTANGTAHPASQVGAAAVGGAAGRPLSGHGQRRPAREADVKEVLKDIFRDKRKHARARNGLSPEPGAGGVTAEPELAGQGQGEVQNTAGTANGLGASEPEQNESAKVPITSNGPLDLSLGKPLN